MYLSDVRLVWKGAAGCSIMNRSYGILTAL